MLSTSHPLSDASSCMIMSDKIFVIYYGVLLSGDKIVFYSDHSYIFVVVFLGLCLGKQRIPQEHANWQGSLFHH